MFYPGDFLRIHLPIILLHFVTPATAQFAYYTDEDYDEDELDELPGQKIVERLSVYYVCV